MPAAIVLILLLAFPSAAAAVDVPVSPAATPTPLDNDYTRIKNAVAAANAGDRIILSGVFDWTETNAAASWGLGNDGLPANADDYSILLPIVNNVEVTANSLGAATIQGPGDLAAENLEGVFSANGGDNQEWTFSNLRILDFDLAIGFFNGAGGSDAFKDVTIENNLIRVPPDLNATAAPADVNQNIGIHYSFGRDQTISSNEIEIAGTGLSAGANSSSTVGMQSNISGGNIYEGLQITGNELRVLGAQSADPDTIIGIWENAHGHTSNVTVRNNVFENLAAGNDPVLNRQRAFRVTSHSSATTTVLYEGNFIEGANRGFEWPPIQNFAGNKPVQLIANVVENAGTGILIQSQGVAFLGGNEIVGSLSSGEGAAGVSVLSGKLEGSAPGTPAAQQNTISGGAGLGIGVQSPNGSVVGTIQENDLSANGEEGFDNNAVGAVDVKLNWWGSAAPESVYPEIAGAVQDPRPWLLEGIDESANPGFQAASNRIALDAGGDAGDAADDEFELTPLGNLTVVSHAGAPLFTGPLTAVGIFGSGDRDQVVVESTIVPVVADVFFRGGGDDDLILDDSARTGAETYVVKPGSVTRAGAGDAVFENATEEIEVRGGSGADSFDVTPSPTSTFSLHGNAPTALPGDTLAYRTEGRPTTRTPPTGPDGEFSAPGVEKVLFTGIEAAELIVPPLTPAPDPAPVLSELRVSPPRIARRKGKPRPVPKLLFKLSEDASVEIVLERRVKGRRVGRRCSPKARQGKRCTAFKRVLSTKAQGKAGQNQVALPKRLRTVPRGTYRVTAVATDSAGQKSAPQTAALRVKS